MTFQSKAMVEQVRGMAERIAASEQLELVDTEWKGGSKHGTLRIYIDKPDGITHADCERVSYQLSAALDVEDVIPASYNLEVSSPGLDRKLSKQSDFSRFAGRKAKVRMREPLHGARHLTGRIAGGPDGKVCLQLARGETLEIPFEDIEQARLVVEL